eukprot:462050_1
MILNTHYYSSSKTAIYHIILCLFVITRTLQTEGLNHSLLEEEICPSQTLEYFWMECGNNKYCYYWNIYPHKQNNTLFKLDMKLNISNKTYVDIYIKPHDNHCISPIFTINYYQNHIISIYNNNTLIKTCQETQTFPHCPTLKICVNNSNIGFNKIDANSIHKITLLLVMNNKTYNNISDSCNFYNTSVNTNHLSIECLQ